MSLLDAAGGDRFTLANLIWVKRRNTRKEQMISA
jgi:hypothetical protein